MRLDLRVRDVPRTVPYRGRSAQLGGLPRNGVEMEHFTEKVAQPRTAKFFVSPDVGSRVQGSFATIAALLDYRTVLQLGAVCRNLC